MEKELKDSLAQEPGVILDNFMNEKKKIVDILNAREPSQLMIGLELVYKACTTNDAQLVTKLLWSLFVYEDCFIKAVCSLGKQELAAMSVESKFLEITTNLLRLLVQKFPENSRSVLEILLPHLLQVSETRGENKHILGELKKLEEVLKVCKEQGENGLEVMFRKLQLEKRKEASTAVTRKAREDSKHITFNARLLPEIPADEETLSDNPFFLRAAIVDGPYNTVGQYVDIHSRLLREDMFRGFRTCLADFYSLKKLENGTLYHYAYIHKVEQTTYGILLYFTVPVPPEVDWKTSKLLVPGLLLCLSCDGFKNFYFGSIESQRNDGQRGTTCYLALRFESGKEPRHILASYDIIQAGGYYEAYRHVFKNLKSLTPSTFPFGKCLLDYKGFDKAPFSLSCNQQRMMRTFQSEINDCNQSQAFELVLKNKIALIQGPPGTGKSYLGAQIVRYLTEIANVRKPIIVMSYTNHALDQFLEKLLNFTDKIVRIGGQSKSQKLESYNLNYLRKLPEIRMRYSFTNRFYGKIKSESILISTHLDECLRSRLYPFTKNAMDLRLCDIYRFHDVLESGKLKGNILNAVKASADKIKLHHWLMTAGSCSEIYDSMDDFKKELTIELLESFHARILQENGNPRLSFLEKRITNPAKLDHLPNLLISLCTKKCLGYFFRLYHIFPAEAKVFVQKYLPSNETVFPLFLRAAVRCAEENGTAINTECGDLLLLNLSERWKLLGLLLFEASALDICQELNSYTYPDEKGGDKLPLFQRGQLFNIQRYKERCRDLKSYYVVEDALVLQRADIIGLTVTGGAKNLDLLKKVNATTYIVEEAAHVFESHVLASFVPSIEHLILIGDHFQLRPSPVVYELAVKYHMDVSLFERLFKNNAPSLCLEVQHRMRPSISGLLVPEFYESLKNHPSVLEYENVGGVSSNVFFLQHSNLENEGGESKSHSNSHEALLIVSLCRYLISQGNDPSSITILTTYNRQLDLINANLQENSVQGVLATTVDNYQGEENDIVLISFVRSNVDRKVGFIKTPNRLCVALSRARKGLYCIGNFNMFASESEIWKSLLTKLQDMSSFGEKLKISCCKHPETTSLISTTSDIENHMGKGCHEPCNKLMDCGHACSVRCHMSKCDDGDCTIKTDITLQCGHTFILPCFCKESPDIITCKKCADRKFHDFVSSYSYRKVLTQHI